MKETTLTEPPTMRFELQHPDNEQTKVVYGRDETPGFFFEIYSDDALHCAYEFPWESERALDDALNGLVENGFVTQTSVEEAQYWLQYYRIEEIANPATRHAAQVIVNMRRALRG